MSEMSGAQYRLRAGSPMPIQDEVGTFVLHSFMAAYNNVLINTCTTELKSSGEFRGQGGQYSSASYSQLPFKTGKYFQSKAATNEVYKEEDYAGFN